MAQSLEGSPSPAQNFPGRHSTHTLGSQRPGPAPTSSLRSPRLRFALSAMLLQFLECAICFLASGPWLSPPPRAPFPELTSRPLWVTPTHPWVWTCPYPAKEALRNSPDAVQDLAGLP